MFNINKLLVLEAFASLKQLSWSEFYEIFPQIKKIDDDAQRLYGILQQLEAGQLISCSESVSTTWIATPKVNKYYKQLRLKVAKTK